MATQEDSGIPFSIANDFTNFRLLELPDELLAILTSPNPPVLSLKSETDSSTAVVCTESKTFPIRQVSTSNTLFVVHSALLSSTDGNELPKDGIRAIASCAATLELSTSKESALSYLRKLLPLYLNRESLETVPGKPAYTSFSAISNDIPLSHSEIEVVWTHICAFEEAGNCYRPTAGALLDIWKAIVSASIAESIPLEKSFPVEDLWTASKDAEFPRRLFNAILERISDQDTMDDGSNSKWCSVDTTKCAVFVGTLILETQIRADQTTHVTEFLESWRNHLLEEWREIPKLELVQDLCIQPNSSRIGLKPELRLSVPPRIAEQEAAEKGSAKARKWHEKFKKGRP